MSIVKAIKLPRTYLSIYPAHYAVISNQRPWSLDNLVHYLSAIVKPNHCIFLLQPDLGVSGKTEELHVKRMQTKPQESIWCQFRWEWQAGVYTDSWLNNCWSVYSLVCLFRSVHDFRTNNFFFLFSDEEDLSVSELSLAEDKTVIENGKYVNGNGVVDK